jgi:hypothetical protein
LPVRASAPVELAAAGRAASGGGGRVGAGQKVEGSGRDVTAQAGGLVGSGYRPGVVLAGRVMLDLHRRAVGSALRREVAGLPVIEAGSSSTCDDRQRAPGLAQMTRKMPSRVHS